MKTENLTETETQTINPETETPKTETRKPRKPKPQNLPELTSLKQIGDTIPKQLFSLFPETETLYKRLSSYGLGRFKFDLGFSTKSTGKRNTVYEFRFFNLPKNKTEKSIPENLNKSANHQITGKTYFKLFPEIKTLFDRLTKQYSANNFRLNISFNHHTKPQTIIEHIIKTDAPSTWKP